MSPQWSRTESASISERLPLSSAVLLGSALIAVAAYLGLRGRAPSGPTDSAPEGGPAEQALTAQAAQRLEQEKRTRFVPLCWAPALSRVSEPRTSSFLVQSVFDAEGKEIARGISELRGEASRPDVAQCLRQLPLALELDPPGRTARVDLRLSFP